MSGGASSMALLPTSHIPSGSCSDPQCTFRDQLRDEQLRCSRLAAANQVLREAQQFLLAKCEAAAEHSNALSLELDVVRKERDAMHMSMRAEKLHFAEQREDLQRRWDHVTSLESSLSNAKKALLTAQQDNASMRDQVFSLQESVNRLTERLAQSSRGRSRTPDKRAVVAPTESIRAEDRPESAGRRGTPPRTRSPPSGKYDARVAYAKPYSLTNKPATATGDRRHYGTLFLDANAVEPSNFYHSPQHSEPLAKPLSDHPAGLRVSYKAPPLDVDRNESEPRPLAVDDFDEDSPPPPPPPQEASMHHRNDITPERMWVHTAVSPAPLPSPLYEYTRPMKEALDAAGYASAGISASLPKLSGSRNRVEAPQTTTSSFLRDYDAYINKRQGSSPDREEAGHVSEGLVRDGAERVLDPRLRRSTSPRMSVTPPATTERTRSPTTMLASLPTRRFDIDAAGLSASVALRRFRDAAAAQPRDGSNSPPPPPPPDVDLEDDDPPPKKDVSEARQGAANAALQFLGLHGLSHQGRISEDSTATALPRTRQQQLQQPNFEEH